MTTQSLKSMASVCLLVVTLSSCGDQGGTDDTAAPPPVAPPASHTPSLTPVLNKVGATFLPVTNLAPIVEGAKIAASASGGYRISSSKTLSGYQVGAVLPSDKVDYVIVRYQINQPTESGLVGILAEDGSRWLAFNEFGPNIEPNGELTSVVEGESVRFIVETKNGIEPFDIEKLEWATFCVKPPSSPDVAPVAEQCYPRLEPIFAFDGARFTTVPALTPWTSEAQVAVGADGAVTIIPSATSSGYQVSADIAKGNTAAVAVKYELDVAGAVGNIGILRGDASAWVATASFGPDKPKSGQIMGLMEGDGVKLVVESAAGAPPIKFRKLEFALLCESKAAQGQVAATFSGCP